MSFRWVNTGDKSVPEFKWEAREGNDTPTYGKTPAYDFNWHDEGGRDGRQHWTSSNR